VPQTFTSNSSSPLPTIGFILEFWHEKGT
jgi:hypothetical protein